MGHWDNKELVTRIGWETSQNNLGHSRERRDAGPFVGHVKTDALGVIKESDGALAVDPFSFQMAHQNLFLVTIAEILKSPKIYIAKLRIEGEFS